MPNEKWLKQPVQVLLLLLVEIDVIVHIPRQQKIQPVVDKSGATASTEKQETAEYTDSGPPGKRGYHRLLPTDRYLSERR
jgi:hypothetical protein